MTDEFPTPNGEARDWIEARCEPGQVMPIDKWRVDAPDCVRAYIAARDRWFAARAEAPIDYAADRNEWRMFGGPWIYGYYEAWGPDGLRLIAVNQATEALRRLGPERFREWAGTFYELDAMRKAIDAKLLAHIRGPA